MKYPKNFWYVAASATEVNNEKPLARTICELDMVLYRDTSGKAYAVHDFCPHRGAPLSQGWVEGDNLVCGYHGLRVDCQGNCAEMDGQPNIHRTKGVDAWPTAERYGYVWIWYGDKEDADEAKLPHMPWGEGGDRAYGGGIYHMKCDHRLLVDNLMDLTHEKYVHSTSIGQHELDEAKPNLEVDEDNNKVIFTRWMHGVTPPPFWAGLYGSSEDVDRWQICEFVPPSNVHIDVGVAKAGTGAPEGDRSQGISALVCDFITPETETTCWYFWGFARDFQTDDEALTDRIREGQGKIFAEDLEMLEAQQNNLLKYSDKRIMTLDIDRGGAAARKIMQRLCED